MKREQITVLISSLIVVCIFYAVHYVTRSRAEEMDRIRVGFVYDGDESTTFTANFMRAQYAMEAEYGDRVEVEVMSNVPDNDAEDALRQLVRKNCDIIFTNSAAYSEISRQIAEEYPEIEICQATGTNAADGPDNYHTFMGAIHEGRYLTGIVAGLKIREMIDQRKITPEEAVVGYIAAYPYAEVISGYTAFLLGVRKIVPEAVMKVVYTYTWSDYKLEKEYAEFLIGEGCVFISQHSDTAGPAEACEELYPDRVVYHVGYNQSMLTIAPTTSVISSRINWEPYIKGAVGALLSGQKIEEAFSCNVWGNDTGGGIKDGWVELLELNSFIAAEGTEEVLEEETQLIRAGEAQIFFGDYTGTAPDDPGDTVDLREEFSECSIQSAPAFGYVLDDVIEVVEVS
ncbi:MAG: BMP family ABC transporter substrate-binding protein [Lachnospiraceae bacterium]|nr:BMP family ABC transporter substrate-binding protein [Lachnospiraceae bacterium]